MSAKEKTLVQKKLIITANSTAYFIIAYVFVISLINFTSLVMAKIFYDLEGTLYHYGFFLDRKSFDWTLESIVLIFFIGVIVAIIFGYIFQKMYQNIRRGPGHFKLFLLWSYLIAYTIFFGDIVFGAFINYMPGAFFNYMFFPMFMRVVIGIIALIMLYVIGQFSTKNALVSLNIYLHKASISEIRPYLIAQFLYPFLLGNAIIFLLKIPYQAAFQYVDTFVLLSMFIIIVSIVINIRKLPSHRFSRPTDKFTLKKIPIVVAIVLMLLFRLVLGSGISY